MKNAGALNLLGCLHGGPEGLEAQQAAPWGIAGYWVPFPTPMSKVLQFVRHTAKEISNRMCFITRVLVTGAGGFIAHPLVRRLKREGFWVRGVNVKRPEFEESSADRFVLADLRIFDQR